MYLQISSSDLKELNHLRMFSTGNGANLLIFGLPMHISWELPQTTPDIVSTPSPFVKTPRRELFSFTFPFAGRKASPWLLINPLTSVGIPY